MKLFNFIIPIVILLSLFGCDNTNINTKNIDSKLFSEGSAISNQLYAIKENKQSYKKFNLSNYENFIKQKDTVNDKVEKNFIINVEKLFVAQTVYLSDYQDDGKIKSNSIKTLDNLANKLNKEYGVQIEE